MIFVVAILLSLLVALLRGGRFERLADLSIRFAPLILLGFLIQILIFTPVLGSVLNQTQTALAYNLSMILIWGTLAVNWRLPGAPLMALGVFLNWLAITANGGFMPASQDALLTAGLLDRATLAEGENFNNTVLVNESTRLAFLADVLAIPSFVPLSNVFSIGDIFLSLGTAWLIQRTTVAPAPLNKIHTPTA